MCVEAGSAYYSAMPEEVGLEFDAARAREAALVQRVKVSAEADRVIAAKVQEAYQATLRGRAQLDGIATDIENAVRNQSAFALDTPAGAGSFMNFLAAKRQEIARVVTEVAADSEAKAALLQSLGSHYAVTPARAKTQLVGFDTFKQPPTGMVYCRAMGKTGGYQCREILPDGTVFTFYFPADVSGAWP